jgi:vacuolar-type H+-ATPase subunit I/STV1
VEEGRSLHIEGGKRRIDRVLSPEFVRALPDLSLVEVKQRRDDALAEREYLSLLRRLVQGRLDILRAEANRRAQGQASAESFVDRLKDVLTDQEEERGSRGEVLRVTVPDEDAEVARRRLERLVADATISNPGGLSDDELAKIERRLGDEERMVSKARVAVMAVHDTLQEELKRRYKEDLSQITTS